MTLDSIILPNDMMWTDEAAWSSVEAPQEYSLGGSLIIETSVKLAGRPITLVGGETFAWSTWGTVAAIMAMAEDPAKEMTLTFSNGRSFTVRFSYSDGSPVTPTAIDDNHPPQDGDKYYFTLRLIEV